MLKTDFSGGGLGRGGGGGVTESWFDYANSISSSTKEPFVESAAHLYLSSASQEQLSPLPISQNLTDMLATSLDVLEQPLVVPLAAATTNLTDDQLEQLMRLYESTYRSEENIRMLLVTFAYSIIFFVSLFGNLMVCHIIITNRKLHTFTNCFIANLSVSDLVMTLINVPFGVTRIVLDSWPFGSFFCSFLPFIQATSVYVSTITMCIISIDRYCVVVHPLGKRITNVVPLTVILAVIWLVSFALATPFAIFNEVTEVDLLIKQIVRCRSITSVEYNKALTMLSFLTQYLLPLTIASVAYASIALSMRQRSKLGAMTREQVGRILKTNRQTITMLVLVLITFAISWLPLHIFCLWRDFSGGNVHYTKVWFAVHWLAMSSVVYNPWIYSARNKHFRNGMKNFFRYLVFKRRSSEATLNGFEAGINANTQATQLSRGPSTRDRVGNGGGVRSSNSSFYLCHSIHRNHICASSFCNRAQACMRSSTSSLEESSTLPSNTIVTTAPTTFHQQQTQPQTQQHPLQSSKINDNSTVHHHHLQSNGKQQQQHHHQPGPQQCHSDTAVVCDVVNCSSSNGQDDSGGRQPNRSSSSSSIADCSSLMAKLSPLIACNRQTDCNAVNHCVINSKNDLAAAETASDDAHLSSPLWPSTKPSAATKLNGFTVQASNQNHSSPVSFSSCHNVSLLSCSPQGDLRLTNYYDNPQKSKSKENDHHHHSRDSVFASPTVVKKCNSTTVVSTTTATTTMSADSNNNEESRV